jgi:hypothetical protein
MASMGRPLLPSSYLTVVALYIHPFLKSTLLQPCSVRIMHLLALSYRQELLPYLYDAARRCNQPAQARSGRVETVNLEFKCARAPDFERHRSLPDMRTAAVLSRPQNVLVGIGRQVEIDTSVAVQSVVRRTLAYDAFVYIHSRATRAHVMHQLSNWHNVYIYCIHVCRACGRIWSCYGKVRRGLLL